MSALRRSLPLLALALLCAAPSRASRKSKRIVRQLKQCIAVLASDSLEGRATGSAGEQRAADYIVRFYRSAGIEPFLGKYSYPFPYTGGKEMAPETALLIEGKPLATGRDVFALPFSADRTVEEDVIPEVNEAGSIWMVPLYQNPEEAANPHFGWEKYAYQKAKECQKMGATAVIFYDAYNSKYPAAFDAASELERIDLPVAVLTYEGYAKSVQHAMGDNLGVRLTTRVRRAELKGDNIAAFIDNHAPYTVILGAHYDHLGYGDPAHSLYRGEPRVHYGADDNASGTAALMVLAQRVKARKLKHYNYLFLHFSGEELGLLGSKAFVADQHVDSSRTAYMINMDMVGRLSDSSRMLTVGGYGTSPVWAQLIDEKKTDLRISRDSSGVGPSDHTSFYNGGIPVLFFFTGAHADYHKPTDVASKINYEGEARIIDYIERLVVKMDKMPKPAFTPTRVTSPAKTDFKVTLGIIPDYSYREENGLRVDAVTQDRPAFAAGIHPGDVITQLGSYRIKGIQSYMEALGRFKPGDRTQVAVWRNKQVIRLSVLFK